MLETQKTFCIAGAFFALIGIAFGAFGAHFLKARYSPDMLNAFEVGVRYLMYHAIALFAIAWAISVFNDRLVSLGGWCLIVGTIIFSGSLYLMVMTAIRSLGAITPIGGVILVIGWLCILLGIFRSH